MADNVPGATIVKWRNLVDRLVSLTEKQRIQWKETVRDDNFIAPIGSVTIDLRKSSRSTDDGGDVVLYVVSLLNSEGKTVESFDDEDIEIGHLTYFSKLDDLMKLITRSLSGADEVLDELLSALEAEDASSSKP